MKNYHVAYYVNESLNEPLLSGLTIKAESISLALKMFFFETDYKVKETQIKYIIQL